MTFLNLLLTWYHLLYHCSASLPPSASLYSIPHLSAPASPSPLLSASASPLLSASASPLLSASVSASPHLSASSSLCLFFFTYTFKPYPSTFPPSTDLSTFSSLSPYPSEPFYRSPHPSASPYPRTHPSSVHLLTI